MLREWRFEPGVGDGGPLGKPGGIALARGGHRGLLALGYTTDRLGNFEFNIIGTADSLTGTSCSSLSLLLPSSSCWEYSDCALIQNSEKKNRYTH